MPLEESKSLEEVLEEEQAEEEESRTRRLHHLWATLFQERFEEKNGDIYYRKHLLDFARRTFWPGGRVYCLWLQLLDVVDI
jgi:hypothetical protein